MIVSFGEIGQRLRAHVDLDARHDAELVQMLRERRAVLGLLAQRLVIKNDAADVIGHVRRGEQQFTIGATRLFSRFQLDAVEALLDGAARLVGGQDTFALCDHRARNRLKFTAIHTFLHLQG